MKLSYSKPICNILNYASIENIEKVMKVYNPGDNTFETDLSSSALSENIKDLSSSALSQNIKACFIIIDDY